MAESAKTVLSVKHLSKTFRLPHERHSSLKGLVLNSIGGRNYEIQQAFKDISFDIQEGEFFGIVGRNGSGKSTLLKCIAGVYAPNEGSVDLKGKLVPFIELGVGFNPELSGRDNVYLNGALLGFSRKEMDAMYDDIVAFSELEKFMDQKLKNYSSGMQVRLAFSIAIRAEGDILLLDEVLAVGDAAFQQKCFDYFAQLKQEKKTIILVSHSMPTIERFCTRALLLEAGEIKHIGPSSDIAAMYEDMILQEEAEKQAVATGTNPLGNGSQVEANVTVMQKGKKVRSLEAGDDFEIVVKMKSKRDFDKVLVSLNLINSENLPLLYVDAVDHIGEVSLKKGKEKTLTISLRNIFTNGSYYFNLGLADATDSSLHQLLKERRITTFTVFGVRRNAESLVHPHVTVTES